MRRLQARVVPSCFLTGVSAEDQSAWSTEAVSRHMLYIKYGCMWEATASPGHFKALYGEPAHQKAAIVLYMWNYIMYNPQLVFVQAFVRRCTL